MKTYLDLVRHILENGEKRRPHGNGNLVGLRCSSEVRFAGRISASDDQESFVFCRWRASLVSERFYQYS